MDLGSPRVSLAALLELSKLLIERRFRRGSPDGFIVVETQHEDLAAPDTISRGRSPAQHAARLAQAGWTEHGATNDRNRPARQRADGRRRRPRATRRTGLLRLSSRLWCRFRLLLRLLAEFYPSKSMEDWLPPNQVRRQPICLGRHENPAFG